MVTQSKPSYLWWRSQFLVSLLLLIALLYWEATDLIVTSSVPTSSVSSFVIPHGLSRIPRRRGTQKETIVSIQQRLTHQCHQEHLQPWTTPKKLGGQSLFYDQLIRHRLQLSPASPLSDFPETKKDGDELGEEPRLTTTTTTTSIGNIKPHLPVLTIPIFPLRKTVKLPTDNITLNLYEPRYIQMVEESILNTPNTTTTSGNRDDISDDNNCHHSLPIFGAMYTTNLPHIVVPTTTTSKNEECNDANTYIVPILEPDMIGAVFIVTNHTTMIQPNGSTKIIRLNATAVLRFRIVKIVHTGGYNDVASLENENNDSPNKPYIVAQVQLLLSDTDTMRTSKSGSVVNSNINSDNLQTSLRNMLADVAGNTNVPLLPNYLSKILNQYGTTLLSLYCDPVTLGMVPRLKMVWIQELLFFHNITSSPSSIRENRVPLYLEQKERLRILSQISTMSSPYYVETKK
jgi:hypothetical protein